MISHPSKNRHGVKPVPVFILPVKNDERKLLVRRGVHTGSGTNYEIDKPLFTACVQLRVIHPFCILYCGISQSAWNNFVFQFCAYSLCSVDSFLCVIFHVWILFAPFFHFLIEFFVEPIQINLFNEYDIAFRSAKHV